MADKFRRSYPIEIKVGEGSLPSSGQFNALSSQARNGLNLVEKAVGDVWNNAGDAILSPAGSSTNAIYAANLARALGQQQLLSPRIPNLSALTKYVDAVVSRDATNGTNENYLRYKPVPAAASLAHTDFTVGTIDPVSAIVSGNGNPGYKTSASALAATGDWHVTADGKLLTFAPIKSAQLTYKPTPISDIDDVAQYTVVPDPATNAADFKGIKIAYANDTDKTDGYWIYLPPRRPLSANRKVALSPNDTGNEVDPAAVGGAFYYYQLGSVAASSNSHWRYKFPAEIQASVDGGSAVALPDNFMYLVDSTTGTIVEGLSFSVDTAAPGTPSRYAVKATGAKLDEIIALDGTLVTLQANEAASAYKSRFSIIFPGTSAARNISALVKQACNHKHNGADGSQPIEHADLLGLYDTQTIKWSPSAFRGDDHPQYLHREGMQAGRDLYRNGLLGDLLLLSTTSGTNYFNNTNDSNRINFGTATKTLYWHQASDSVTVEGADLRLGTAAKRLEFDTDNTTVYLDKTRMKALWDAMNMVKTYRAIITATNNSISTTAYTVSIVIPAPPSGLEYDVTGSASFSIERVSGSGTPTSSITINSGTFDSNLITQTVLASTDIHAVSVSGQGGRYSTTKTFTFSISSLSTLSVNLTGMFVVTVHPYVA